MQQRAVDAQDWEEAAPDRPCPCSTSLCGHGEPCPADDCEGHEIHTMRNPTTSDDVTAWEDHFECSDGCGATTLRRELPDQPWGEIDGDGEVQVYDGVNHYELGVYA